MSIERRRFSRRLFLGGMAVATVGAAASFVRFLWRDEEKEPSPEYVVKAGDVPAEGDEPFFHKAGAFYLVNLTPAEAVLAGRAPGLAVLSDACPHLRGDCPARWDEDLEFVDPVTAEEITGWFRCPCHGSTFAKSGRRVFGPAHSGLAELEYEVTDVGNVNVRVDRSERTMEEG